MDCKIVKFILLIFFINFKVLAVEFDGKFIQGHFIIGKTDPNSKIKIDKKQVKVTKDGYFAFGIGRDRKYDLVINIEVNGFYSMNYLSYWSLRIGGFVAWNGHRKRNAKIK